LVEIAQTRTFMSEQQKNRHSEQRRRTKALE